MPKLGMKPVRRRALIDATIAEIGEMGTLDVTVGRIAKRAGMSSGLAHHYFGSKEQIFLAAMRHIMQLYVAEVRAALKGAKTPRARVSAIVRANFAPTNFTPEAVAAWLNFYVYAQTVPEARRLLNIYSRRIHSNLMAGLLPLCERATAVTIARSTTALIDGFYLQYTLHDTAMPSEEIVRIIEDTIDRQLDGS